MTAPSANDDPGSKKELVKSSEDKNGKEKEENADEKSTNKEPTKFDLFCEKLNVNPNLIMLKITLFVMYGATASLLPYLTIHMQSIGLTVEEIAIVYLALPLTTFLSPPITGFLVDKLGHYKPVVVLTLVLNAVFHHSLLLIPPLETPGITPAAFVMRHPKKGIVDVWWSPCPSRECPDDEGAVDMVLDDCFDHCKLWKPQPVPPRKSLLTEIHKGIAVRPPTLVAEKPSPLKDMNIPGPGGPNDDLHFRPSGKKKSKNGNSTSKATTQSPSTNDTGQTTSAVSPINVTRQLPEDIPFQFRIKLHENLMDPQDSSEEDPEPSDDFTSHFPQTLLESNGVNFTALLDEDLRCGGNVQATNLTYKTLNNLARDCMLQRCSFREGGPEKCPPDFEESDDRTFWTYFALRFLGTVMLTGGVTMMDPIALSLIQEHGGEFGRERLSSSVGMAIFSPLTGLLIDYCSQNADYTDYSSAFYAYDVLLLSSAVFLLMMPKVNNPPSDHIFTDLMRLIGLPHIMAFIFFLFVLGNFWGFIESFLFLYLKELGAPSYLLGITVTVGTVSSMPFLWGAEKITKRFGHINVVVLAFFSHAVRLMGYSFIESAWWCFPFEAIESVSVHLMWVAAATYCTVLAPKSLLATLIGVLGMAHFSLGRGSGSFLGGLLIGTVGTRRAFRIMGLIAVTGGICYGVLQKFWLGKIAKKHAEKQETNDDPEAARLNGETNGAATAAEEMTRASLERLSLMIQFNQRGSLTSLDRGSRMDLRPGDRRRSSGNVRRSTSRVDLRKSTLEMSLQQSQQSKGSTPALNSSRGTLVPKGVPLPITRKSQRIPSISALSARRDSIREEAEEHAEENEKVVPLPIPSSQTQQLDKANTTAP